MICASRGDSRNRLVAPRAQTGRPLPAHEQPHITGHFSRIISRHEEALPASLSQSLISPHARLLCADDSAYTRALLYYYDREEYSRGDVCERGGEGGHHGE